MMHFFCAVIPFIWQIFNEHILCARHSSQCWGHSHEQNSLSSRSLYSVGRRQTRCMSDGEKCWGGQKQSKEKSLGLGNGASLDMFKWREQQVQRPWKGTIESIGYIDTTPRGQCGWNRVNKGDRGIDEVGEITQADYGGPETTLWISLCVSWKAGGRGD